MKLGLIAVALAVVTTPRVVGHQPTMFGFNDAPQVVAANAGEARALGANVARLNVPASNNPESIRPYVEAVRAAGQRPILSLYATLRWGDPLPSPEVFRNQAMAFGRAYPGAIIQLLNEPNHKWFGELTPKQTARLITPAARALRQMGVKAIGPGLSPGTDLNALWHYVKSLYRRLPDYVDPALHIYLYGKDPMDDLGRFYHKAASAFGPPWITEYGVFGNSYGGRQPYVTAQGYRKLDRLGARAVIVHRMLPDPEPSDWEKAANMSVLDRPAMREALAQARREYR